MWTTNSYTICYLLLLVTTTPAPAAAVLPSTALEIQSNQSLALGTPSPANTLFAPLIPPEPPIPGGILKCFSPGQEGALPPKFEDCEVAIEYILHVYPPGPMVYQNFSRTDADGTRRVPEAFEVKNCQILISNRKLGSDAWDILRYVDVVIGAQEVLKFCVSGSKFGFGGVAVLGNRGTYVAVNGLFTAEDYGAVSEEGNGTNATTSMGTGTAGISPLEMGVSELLQEEELDEEDGKLSMT